MKRSRTQRSRFLALPIFSRALKAPRCLPRKWQAIINPDLITPGLLDLHQATGSPRTRTSRCGAARRRAEPSRILRRTATRLRSTRGFHACHQVLRIFRWAHRCGELTLIELADGTAITIGTPCSPISSRRIASYFHYVIRRTNQDLFREHSR